MSAAIALVVVCGLVYLVTTIKYAKGKWRAWYGRYLRARGESIEAKSDHQVEAARCAWIVMHWATFLGLVVSALLLNVHVALIIIPGFAAGIASMAVTYYGLLREMKAKGDSGDRS